MSAAVNIAEQKSRTRFADVAPQAVRNGFDTIPIVYGEKRCVIPKWTTMLIDPNQVDELIANGEANSGMGIRTGRVVGIDIDVKHEDVVKGLLAVFPADILKRVGQYPSVMVPFRNDGNLFGKRRSAEYEDDNGNTQFIELLGEGAQFVAFGIHPKTQEPYRWFGGSPTTVSVDDLPEFTEDFWDALCEAFEKLAEGQGWTKIKNRSDAPSLPVNDRTALTHAPLEQSKPDRSTIEGAGIGYALRTPEEVMAVLNQLPHWVDPHDDWVRVGMALHHYYEGWEEGLDLWEEWSSNGANFQEGVCAKRWKSFRHTREKGVTFATLVREAKRVTKAAAAALEQQRSSAFFCAASLDGVTIPPRDMLIDDWLPGKEVALIFGDGGTGKSLMTLQLAMACSVGDPWLGLTINAPGPALYISAEDARDEVSRRVQEIAKAMGRPVSDFGDVQLRSLAGECALLAHDNEPLIPTALYHEIKAFIGDHNPRVVILDTLADLYPANENERSKVRQFMGLLKRIAIEEEVTVIMLAHPSLSGMSSGSGTSGSTAWNNSARSRLYLTRLDKKDSNYSENARRLTNHKLNYGAQGSHIDIHWNDGAFTVEAPQSPEMVKMSLEIANAEIDAFFIEMLTTFASQGLTVSAKAGANSGPRLFAKEDAAKARGFTKLRLEQAQRRLIGSGKVSVIDVGSPSRRQQHLVVSDPPETGDD